MLPRAGPARSAVGTGLGRTARGVPDRRGGEGKGRPPAGSTGGGRRGAALRLPGAEPLGAVRL